MRFQLGLGFSLALGLLACSSGIKTHPAGEAENAASQSTQSTPQISSHRPTSLSREESQTRFKQISRASYLLWFGLDPYEDRFEGRTVIHFDLKPKAKELGKPLLIDLEAGKLHSVTINGTQIQDLQSTSRYDGHHLYIGLNELNPSGNQIKINYSHVYSTNGNGLHRFKDPADSQIYLYSDFEPYSAHQLFPCFDQPDIKATYEVTAEVPKDWQVISNTLEREISNVDGRKSWIFPATAPFSTYVFALHAGPYAQWKADANGIPIRLFARKSLAKYIDYQEWLSITRAGLDYFSVQFGLPYPFVKYDQVIVPDFNAGAMENVGAVTFSEHYVYRTKATQDRHRRRADTILHEMAHMWFGDLVTMKWWNGLWLNESFATFMAARGVDEATSFPGSWQSFFSEMKKWAYWEDQLVTTHPIEQPVNNTDEAEAIFDGITYGKGASSLKQLSFYLGDDDFREGVQRYFQRFAYRNTTLTDFIKMLSEASSQDLGLWQKLWLQTPGVNTIKTEWSCDVNPDTEQSEITRFNLLQLPSEVNSELRPHKTQIALFYFPNKTNKSKSHKRTDELTTTKPIEVTYSTAKTLVGEAIGKPCPDFVFPNYMDQDYVKIELDETSLKTALKSIGRISDSFTRQMVWHTLWEMVIDGKLRAQDYAETAMNSIQNETQTLILSDILDHLDDPSAHADSVLKFLPPSSRKDYVEKLEKWAKAYLTQAPGGSDQQIIWFQEYLDVVSSPTGVQFLRDLLKGKQKLRGFPMDQEHRWEIVETLARTNESDIISLIQKELENDKTDMGEKAALSAEVAIPNAETKSKWLAQITKKQGNLPQAKLREIMENFHIIGQENLTRESVNTYFEALPQFALSKNIQDIEYARWFTQLMFPSLCDKEIVEKTSKLLDTYPQLPAPIVKKLKVFRQEEERCIRARDLASKP